MDVSQVYEKKVIIIGGGVIGCSVAYELVKLGYKPTVVERESCVACGASGKAGGFLARDWNNGRPTAELAKRSYQLHEKYSKIFTQTGYRKLETYSLSVHPPKPQFEGSVESNDALSWLAKSTISNITHLSDGSQSAQVNPRLFTESLANEVVSKGGKIVQGKADRFVVDSNRRITHLQVIVKEVENSNQVSTIDIEGDVFVVCIGAWSDVLLQSIFKRPLMGAIRATSIVLSPTSEVPPTALFTDWYTPGYKNSFDPEVYPRPDNTVYICAQAEPVVPPSGGVSSVVPDPDVVSKIQQYAGQLSPALFDAPLLASQACLLPTTMDDIPIIGKLSNDYITNIYVATGHSCWGILNAPATGEAIAQLIHTGTSDLDLSNFDPNRFF